MKPLAAIVFVAACGSSRIMSDASVDAPAPDARRPGKLVAYIGGYAPSIAWADVSRGSGALTLSSSVAATDPSFLAVLPDASAVYAVSESGNRVAAFAIAATGALTPIDDQPSGGSGPAHVAVDHTGKWVFVSNYGDGGIAVYPVRSDRGVGAAVQSMHAGTNAHQMIADPSNRYVFVPCLGSDYVAQYRFDAQTGALTPNGTFATTAGAGPRHLAFAPDGVHAYLANELASTLTALALDTSTGKLSALQTVSLRPPNATGSNTAAEVWVHPNGRFVFASNRGDDTIATFSIDAAGKVALVASTPTGGKTPRDFTLDAAGANLYVANQGSGNVVQFTVDASSGALTPNGSPITSTAPTFIGIVELP
jgi:6-phosphogluconolactonase